MSDDFLSRLRGLLQEQSAIPPLPTDWAWESAMLAAHGLDYGGDFFVAESLDVPGCGLQMVLVDVCGQGTAALPEAVQFAGALRAIMGSAAPADVMTAANRYLLALPSDEAIATAAQVVLSFDSGEFQIRSAGHPPVLRWRAEGGSCEVDGARGTALGVVPDPELEVTSGRLWPGDALVFYTDGVVESRGTDIEDGIAWLQDRVRAEMPAGPGVAQRVIEQVERGDDDRAILVLSRQPARESSPE